MQKIGIGKTIGIGKMGVLEPTFEYVRRILAAHLSISQSHITRESHLCDELGVDSLDTAELIMSLEDAFGVRLGSPQKDNLKTVDDIVNLVDSIKASAYKASA
ncbi:MAG: acyl carrier protein [Coriobacteriia bacterium]|nr:acyl carrier protein [Coriobacteriia bacterium]